MDYLVCGRGTLFYEDKDTTSSNLLKNIIREPQIACPLKKRPFLVVGRAAQRVKQWPDEDEIENRNLQFSPIYDI